MTAPPTYDDILAAAGRIEGHAVRTPLLESLLLNEAAGGRLLVKPENLQKTGSFKFRGAYNNIAALPDDARARGVVAYSSGNHAQGVAAAAALLGVPALIVMPEDAPAPKIANTRAYGAEIVLYDRYGESREDIAQAIATERGATLVPPYDHPKTVAGQGTVGLEIAAQCEAAGIVPDAVLVCCGGGGLVAGIALALERLLPETSVYAVEPKAFDDTARSLEAGTRQTVPTDARSICDALLSPSPGEITFPINLRLLAGAVAVSDNQALDAMATAFAHLKIVSEPGGAVAMAAALSGAFALDGRTAVAVCSGGNAEPGLFKKALERLEGP